MDQTGNRPDKLVALLLILGIVAFSLFLQNQFDIRKSLLFLVGAGLGFSLLHAAFGFTGAWRSLLTKQHGAGVRAQILLIALTSLLFFPILGNVFEGIKVAPALAPVGISVLVGAFVFGVGMQLGGGCGSGTLFTVGGGHTRMLLVLAFFIVGATIGSVHLPTWLELPNMGPVSIISEFGWSAALAGQLILLVVLYLVTSKIEKRRHGSTVPVIAGTQQKNLLDRLIFGPWPLWWAVVSLAVLNLATLFIAGHPWTITFAFGLWGTKIWSAMGGDISSWTFWQSGYAANALNSSVLSDATSLMDAGIIIGAMLAAALAGRFAPDNKIDGKAVMTAVLGGLLMGYGARLAFGCNIGGLLAGISSGSLHGWLWLVAGFAGSFVGIRMRTWFRVDKPDKA